MTVRTFPLNPAESSFIGFTAAAKGRPELPFFRKNDEGTETRIQTITKNDQHLHSFMRFDFGQNEPSIPANSLIIDAFLRLFVDGVQISAFGNISCSLVARDGIWDVDGGTYSIGAPVQNDGQKTIHEVVGRDGGGTQFFATNPTGLGADWPFKNSIVDSTINMAQPFLNMSAGTLVTYDVTMRRVGSGGATVNVTMHPIRENGTVDEDTVLATSNNLAWNTIPTASGVVSFTFSPGVSITAGQNRAFQINTTQPSGGVFLEMHIFVVSNMDEPMQIGGIPRAFADPNYAQDGELPLLYEADNATIRTAPHGSISNIPTFPPFPVDDAFVEVRPPNFHRLIQEWIDDPLYAENERIAVQFSPRSVSEVPALRRWDDMELVVEFLPGNAAVHEVRLEVAPSETLLEVSGEELKVPGVVFLVIQPEFGE